MTDNHVERRLAAILAADVAGYSRLMGVDEEGVLARLKAARKSLVDPVITAHRGRTVKTTGDGMLVEFASVVDAARCAIDVQRHMAEQNATAPQVDRIEFRVGIHLGDIMIDENDIFGDGVNIAARLEGIAEPGSICISDDAQRQIRGKVDIAFEDMGLQTLKNIIEPMRVWRLRINASGPATTSMKPPVETIQALALPDRPSIAVLPFANLSGDPGQDYFVDGMVEEIITALSRIRWLFVIAGNSSFTYKGHVVDVKQVGRELGVRYVLGGSVRKLGNRVRITGQLIDATTGAHLWADRSDSSLEDLFDMQDKVASSVAGVIEPALQAAETARSANRPTADLTAYDLYLQAYAMVLSSVRQARDALCLLEQAIARDPRYGPALAWAAICCLRLVWDGRSEDQMADSLKGIDFARRALEVAGDDPGTLANAAQVLAYFDEDVGTMMALVDRALSFNPNYARGWHISGTLRMWAGQPDIAIEHMEVALRLSPRARIGQSFAAIGRAHLLTRRFEAAIPKLLLAIQEDPSFPNPYFSLAACYAHMGRLDDAREILARLRAVARAVIPDVMHERSAIAREISHFRDPQHRELLLSGLQLAGGQTT